jgi:hypothetical protein
MQTRYKANIPDTSCFVTNSYFCVHGLQIRAIGKILPKKDFLDYHFENIFIK